MGSIFILYVHVEDDIISPRCDTIFDIHFHLRDTADFVPHTLDSSIMQVAQSTPIDFKVVLIRCQFMLHTVVYTVHYTIATTCTSTMYYTPVHLKYRILTVLGLIHFSDQSYPGLLIIV